MFSTIPPNPINASEIKDAAIRVAASPRKGVGIFVSLIRERKPEKSTIANKNPSPQPRVLAIDSIKLYPSRILFIVTPRTAQFVVMRGRYTPRPL